MAIYNSVILDITFPLVVFKKLLGGTDYQAINAKGWMRVTSGLIRSGDI